MSYHPDYSWLLHLASWEELGELCVGIKWNYVNFTPVHATAVPAASGLYLLCGSPPKRANALCEGKLMNVLYAGKTNNLRRRFREHLNSHDANISAIRYVFAESLAFWYGVISHSQKLSSIESIAAACFRPAANRHLFRGRVSFKAVSAHSRKTR